MTTQTLIARLANKQAKLLSRSFFCRHRFALISMETRFGDVEWLINDAEITAPDGAPETVYQGDYSGAMKFIAREQEKEFAQKLAHFD